MTMSILFVGAANLDTVIHVDKFPVPDQKVRAMFQSVEGGGNAANSTHAAAQLGVQATLFTVIGDDYSSQLIKDQLRSPNVNLQFVVSKHNTHSGTTTVLVSRADATRTCIHNAMHEELQPDDVDELLQTPGALAQHQIIHFDSRHTHSSVYLCSQLAPWRGLISIDAEKLRPGIFDLIPYCDIIFCNQHFPSLCCEASKLSQEQKVMTILERPWADRCQMVVCTLGTQGCLLVLRPGCMEALYSKLPSGDTGVAENGASTAWAGLEQEIHQCPYRPVVVRQECVSSLGGLPLTVVRCAAWDIAAADVVDTTGAGDVFIAAFLAAVLHRWSDPANCARLGALAAAEKLKQPGARRGAPTVERIRELLTTTFATRGIAATVWRADK